MSTSESPSASQPSLVERPSSNGEDDEIDSLPDSESASSSSLTISDSALDDDEESDAEKEWKESLQQLELLLTMVVVPYVGKYFGRKCAYWGESGPDYGVVDRRLKFELMDRMGKVHGMEIPSRGGGDEQGYFQSHRGR